MTNAENLVTIATFPEPMEANMARSAIESAGIAVFLQGETANSLLPVAFSSRLQVRPEDEAAARSVLDALDQAPESLESVTAAEIEAESDAQFDAQRGAISAKDPVR
jgi:hypothetical protein